jgi:hypothetical protein
MQKNSVPLKEVLTARREGVQSDDRDDATKRSHHDAKSAATTCIGVYKNCRKRLCCSAFLNRAIDDRYSIKFVATH